jgi:dienelactone hydrolase
MLNFGTGALAPSYFLFAVLAVLGTLQLVATRYRLMGLSLIRGRQRTMWGYLLGTTLVGGGFGWFFTAQREEIFRPGLAGAELLVLFALASLGALGSTLLLASLLQRSPARASPDLPPPQEVTFGPGRGMLYLPGNRDGPGPAICVLLSLEGGNDAPALLASVLTREGFAVLALDLGARPRYPEVLALLPAAQAYLAQREEVDEKRLGVLGFDLGADLALRSASSDEAIKAVVALAPLLEEASLQPGLALLREMSYGQAIRWARHPTRREVLRKLNPLSHMAQLEGRPLLVVCGEEDSLIPPQRAQQALAESHSTVELRVVPGEQHLTLAYSPEVAHLVAQWFRERR